MVLEWNEIGQDLFMSFQHCLVDYNSDESTMLFTATGKSAYH